MKNKFNIPEELSKHVRWTPEELLGDKESVLVMYITSEMVSGKEVVGDLGYVVYQSKKVIPVYNHNTFDEEYKEKYPEYFLADDAPENLKDFFYTPLNSYMKCINNISYPIYHPAELTLEFYKDNIKWLKGKDLSRFKIKPGVRAMIQVAEVREQAEYELTRTRVKNPKTLAL